VQDNFHVSRNLTVNLGLRYEAHPTPFVSNNQLETFDLKNKAMVLGQPTSWYVRPSCPLVWQGRRGGSPLCQLLVLGQSLAECQHLP
jgi:hypothetical protein